MIVGGRNSSTASQTAWTQSCVEKWVRAKTELKVKMENWKEDWRTAAIEWIDKITIEIGEEWTPDTPLVIRFPLGTSSSFQKFTITITPTASMRNEIPKTRSVDIRFADGDDTGQVIPDDMPSSWIRSDDLMKHHQSVFQDYRDSRWMPINLFANVVDHITATFDRKLYFALQSTQSPRPIYKNHLYFRKQHLFPDFALSSAQDAQDAKSIQEDGGWTCVDYEVIITDDQLAHDHNYRKTLIDKLCAHQTRCLIDCHFAKRSQFDKLNGQILDNARHFAMSLKISNCQSDCSRLDISSSFFKIGVRIKTIDKIANFSFYDLANDKHYPFDTFQECSAVPIDLLGSKEITEVTKMHGDLTNLNSHDLYSIIRIVVEVYFCGVQLKKIIFSSMSEFPGADDHFDNFDEPSLRGVLTTTSVARKLVNHAKNIELLRKNVSGSNYPVPAALIDLMESYLTPLL